MARKFLLRSTSAVALGLAGSLLGSVAAVADCVTSGTTVICQGNVNGNTNGNAGGNGFGDGSENGLTINVQQGASVTGDNNALFLDNNNSINNSGTITAPGNRGDGIDAASPLVVSNSGTISGGEAAIRGNTGNVGTITISGNTGTISGGISAIMSDGAVNITNNTGGTITSTDANIGLVSSAIEFSDGKSIITNEAGATIQGLGRAEGINGNSTGGGVLTVTISNAGVISGERAIDLANSTTASIFNSGSIISTSAGALEAIVFGGGNNTLTLGTTSFIKGVVFGSGSDILQLGGTTGNGAFNLSDIGPNQQYRGFSTFNKIDTSTWTVTGSGNQDWTVQDGTFLVDGTINGKVNVQGGTLGGNGSVGATTVAGGATLSPGHNGIGTLTVNGNLAFQSGSTYLFGVSGNSAGRTNVTGAASLTGATAQAVFTGGIFNNNFTILSAQGGLGGTKFSGFIFNNPTISPKLSYSKDTDVILTLTSDFTSLGGPSGLTRNQTAVASALDNALNNGGKALVGLLNLSTSQLPAAFDILSGEGTSATQETAFAAGQQFTSLMMQQGAFWRSGAVADPNGVTYPAPMSYASEEARPATLPAVFKAMPAKAQNFEQRWRGWTAGFDNASSLRGEADPGSADQTHRTAGGAAGLDYQVNPNLLLGVAGGGSSSSFQANDRATRGNLDGAHVGGYGVARWNAWYAAGTLAFASFDNKTSRTIFGVGPTESAQGSFRSELLSGRFELGWTHAFNGFAVTPFAAVEVAKLWQRGYSETGTASDGTPGVNGLSYAGHTASSLPTFLGAQVDSHLAFAGGMIWSPYARVSWVHEFERARSISAAFIALPGSAFTVDGPRAAGDAARLDLGSQLALTRNVALFGSFDGEFADRSRMLTGKGGLDVKW